MMKQEAHEMTQEEMREELSQELARMRALRRGWFHAMFEPSAELPEDLPIGEVITYAAFVEARRIAEDCIAHGQRPWLFPTPEGGIHIDTQPWERDDGTVYTGANVYPDGRVDHDQQLL